MIDNKTKYLIVKKLNNTQIFCLCLCGLFTFILSLLIISLIAPESLPAFFGIF